MIDPSFNRARSRADNYEVETPDFKALEEAMAQAPDNEKVVNLAVYKIKKSLKEEGFDLITDDNGKLTLVMRLNSR